MVEVSEIRARKAAGICVLLILLAVVICAFADGAATISGYAATPEMQEGVADESSQDLSDDLEDRSIPQETTHDSGSGDGVAKESYASMLWKILSDSDHLQDGHNIDSDLISGLEGAGFGVFTDREGGEIPNWMQKEIPDLNVCESWVANRDFTLVGFFSGSDKRAVSKVFIDGCKKLGWVVLDDAVSTDTATMVKEKGDCRWMMATFVQIGEKTSIVLHIRHV